MNPIISFTTEPELLIEEEETVSLLNFNLNEPPSDTGTVVSINAPNLAEFNLTQTQVERGEITLEPELQQQLNDALDATRVEEVPGAVVAIVSPFGSWFGTSGVANLENNTPLQPDDRFPIGSITKTFVATTALQLVEEGQLSLSDTLTTWLPESVTADIPNASEITLEQLLQHTSGVADYIDVLFNQGATNPGIFLTDLQPEELVDFIDGVEPLFAPGESWEYSNTNFILAGLVVEAATGNNIASEIRTRIIEPLNLENTFFAEEEEIPGGFVSGYWDFNQDGTLDNITSANLSWAWATGAMVSNTVDLDTFARSLFKGELLEPETLDKMLDTIPAIDNNNYSSYGLGVGTIESPNRFWYIHRGLVLGYRSNMWYSPQDDFTYIELINGFSNDNLVRDLLPPFRVGISDETFDFTITEQNAQISLPVLNDGEIEGEETAIFTVENGEGYEVKSDAQTGTFTIVDSGNENSEIEPIVSFSTEPELLIESQETVSLLNFSLSEAPPEIGTTVTVSTPNLSEFNLSSIQTQGGEINLNNETRSQLETALAQKVTAQVPGATIAITSPLGNWLEAAGVANIENNTPLQPDDRFQIGSITKTFTATTVLKLAEAGALTLEDTLTDWLPQEITADIPSADEITIRQLLNHTSGIAEYDNILLQQAVTNPTIFLNDWQPEEIVELINGVEPFFTPGESWQYSNTNYTLAGMVIEAATGNNIAAEMRAQIFEPLNLKNTFFAGEEEIPGGYVKGYLDFDLDGILDDVSVANPSWTWTNGAIVSNTEDLTQFAQSLYAGELLSEASIAEMFTLVDTGRGFSYGLGMMSFETPDLGTVVGHRGGTLGFNANMWYSSEDDFTYVDLANGRTNEELVIDTIPAFTEGVIPTVGNNNTYSEFDFTITEQNAQISLPVLNDGEIEGEETAIFTVENGEGYEVETDANSGTFTIVDTLLEPPAPLPNVALGAFPDTVAEDEDNLLTLFFEVDGLPADGLYVYVDSETPQSLSQFDLNQAVVNGAESLVINPDLSGFAIKLFADDASIEIPVAVDEIEEGIIDITYELKTRDEISSEDLAAIETVDFISDYVINPQMVGETITVFDTFFVIDQENPVKPEPIFGTLEEDIIEVNGSGGLIFGGDESDVIDASVGSMSNNRIYAGSGDDTLILGNGDRLIGGEGADKFFALSGGDNIITGGEGADQIWIATAEIPDSANIITDFTSGEDILGIAGLGIGFDDLSITQQDDRTLITTNNSELAILQGISADSLIADNFAFV